ncbi:helix-turn-helix domain-containing protein [Enterovibrio sp. ZSDZ42]|uniref:Helix-turn-helix domain-containing protein n=1 Tax=Enterovibrio gelatinilyticus TaxID=2899819 RepID=A0ABT5QXB6_9GAMM|nr:Ada metal-binding domain-containing protein [Enterovibrio sp. ZSDZ42]MDD1792176.1 helix-turn-helix domain-containing protein [Enterovibrio sp. ZSDZ42]
MDTTTHFQQARLSRDARFDGLFYTAVVSTGIYCRPVCPAPPPKEENVRYYTTAYEAASQGFRPCLRCRPDSAPGSPAWLGKQTTFRRALRLIDDGYLQDNSIPTLAEKLGVSDRYLRKLFTESLGCSPKQYALYQQILFAKKLLHETTIPIADIAFASGFNSIRRFNDCFQQQLSLSPTQVRGKQSTPSDSIVVTLSFRPPYHWQHFHSAISKTMISNVEWLDHNSYGRTFMLGTLCGQFTATLEPKKHRFVVELKLSEPKYLFAALNHIRRLLDLDANPDAITLALRTVLPSHQPLVTRIPGVWDTFEAGVRAIFGESLNNDQDQDQVIHTSIEPLLIENPEKGIAYFPSAEKVLTDLDSYPLSAQEKHRLSSWAKYCLSKQASSDFVNAQGQPLTEAQYAYACLRGAGLPDIAALSNPASLVHDAQPWRSYFALSTHYKDIS